jgi:2-hydroxychromene-2-carboxylate isomerase
MGELIQLGDWRGARHRAPQFIYNLACPLSYLAAEQVERSLGQVDWIPAWAADFSSPDRSEAARQAHALQLPLVWPERYPAPPLQAYRVAAAATAEGHGARFGLAALRLAFCGGFDLDDPEILCEAAAAAGLDAEACREAANDPWWDEVVASAGARLSSLPVVRINGALFSGAQAVVQAAALADARSA